MADLFPTFRRVPLWGWPVIIILLTGLTAAFHFSMPTAGHVLMKAEFYHLTLEREALKGNPDSQYLLAKHYRGQTPPQLEKAFGWYLKAAEQGHRQAQNDVGASYLRGDGIPQDTQKAILWYEKSASQGEILAQINLGNLYRNGEKIEQDYAKALEWYEKAAQHNSDAQNVVGVMHQLGQGTLIDLDRAAHYYEQAAEAGNTIAQQNLAYLYLQQTGDTEKTGKGLLWLNQAAEGNSLHALQTLGDTYHQGKGVPVNTAKAITYYERGAAQGDSWSIARLCSLHHSENDFIQALPWCEKAAAANEAASFPILGFYYLNGHGVEKDLLKAGSYLRKAAEKESSYASKMLFSAIGNCFLAKPDEEGFFSEREVETCLVSAGAGDNNIAFYNASLIYEKGYPDLGIPKDTIKATELRQKAFASGYNPRLHK